MYRLDIKLILRNLNMSRDLIMVFQDIYQRPKNWAKVDCWLPKFKFGLISRIAEKKIFKLSKLNTQWPSYSTVFYPGKIGDIFGFSFIFLKSFQDVIFCKNLKM